MSLYDTPMSISSYMDMINGMNPVAQNTGMFITPTQSVNAAGLSSINSILGNTGLNFDGTKLNNLGYSLGNNPPMNTGWSSLSTMDKVNTGLGLTQGIGSLYNGYQANKLAKQQLAFQKDSFNKTYEAQKNLTNDQLERRQAARVRRSEFNGRDEMSVSDYMNKYGVK